MPTLVRTNWQHHGCDVKAQATIAKGFKYIDVARAVGLCESGYSCRIVSSPCLHIVTSKSGRCGNIRLVRDQSQLNGMGGVNCEDCDIAQSVPGDYQGLDGMRPSATDGLGALGLGVVIGKSRRTLKIEDHYAPQKKL